MPKKYVLKKSLVNQNEFNRLLKTIKEAAERDRIEGVELLNLVKAELADRAATAADNPENPFPIDSFVKLVSSALSSLAQMGNANDKLLKLAALVQRAISGAQESDGKGKSTKSIFDELTNLTRPDKKDE